MLIRVADERASRLRLCWGSGASRVRRNVAADRATLTPPLAANSLAWASSSWPSCASAAKAPLGPPHAAGGFRQLIKWRTGSEGRVSALRRNGGWSRSLMDDLTCTQTLCGYGIFTDNATKSAAWSPPTRRRD